MTGSQLVKMFASIKGADAIADSLNKAMKEFSINTRIKQAAFIAQTAHESGSFSRFIENLNYSAKRLTEVFPSRFKTLASAVPYGNKPEKIANFLYSGRYGNGNEASGDGWRYRGRGAIQITFKNNYKKCGLGLSLDLVTNPDLLLEPKDNIYRSAAWFWSDRKLNTLADVGDTKAITKIINGGYNGLDERIKYYTKAKSVFGI